MTAQRLAKTRTITRRRLITLTAALALAALAMATASIAVLAQGGGLTLVNHDRDFVERKKDGGFVARPVFDRQVDAIHYGIRHPETGDWIAPMYRVHSSGKSIREGREYSWHYPAVSQQPDLDPDRAYLLVIVAIHGGEAHTFNVVIPIHRSTSLWDRVLGALDPSRWARAFAAWIVEAVFGALCSIVERASGTDACGEG
ncbi:MAG: hypothetical protein F4045_01175 [Chloroflexi bacterium]|nr:hypothetical protein [Chloroflexota bacterium]